MRRVKHIFLLVFITLSVTMSTLGQCVMCKALGEQSAAQGGLGSGLNEGNFIHNDYPIFTNRV